MKVILTAYVPAILLAVALPLAHPQDSRPQAPAAPAQVKPPASNAGPVQEPAGLDAKPAPAQPPNAGVAANVVQGVLPLPPPAWPAVDIDPALFPGDSGTRPNEELRIHEQPLPEMVDILRKLYPELNFVITPSVATPKSREAFFVTFLLRGARLGDILNAIVYATDEAVTWKLVGNNLVVFQLRPDRLPSPPPPTATPLTKRSFQVINLSTVLGADSDDSAKRKLIEEIRTLTVETLKRLYDDFDANTQMSDCNYHGGTGLLVLVGPDIANRAFVEILQRVDKPKLSGKVKPEPPAPPVVVPAPAAPAQPK